MGIFAHPWSVRWTFLQMMHTVHGCEFLIYCICYLLLRKLHVPICTHRHRRHWCQSRCHCPGKHVRQNQQDGSPGNKWSGPHVQQNILSRTWFRERGLPGRGRWWELREIDSEYERKAGHMWDKLPDILWHFLPGDIHVSLGSWKPSWEKTLQTPHLQWEGRGSDRIGPGTKCNMLQALQNWMLVLYNI